jgi:hypothetical protein
VTVPSEQEMKNPVPIESLVLPLPLTQRVTLLSEADDLVTDVDEQVRSTESMFQG